MVRWGVENTRCPFLPRLSKIPQLRLHAMFEKQREGGEGTSRERSERRKVRKWNKRESKTEGATTRARARRGRYVQDEDAPSRSIDQSLLGESGAMTTTESGLHGLGVLGVLEVLGGPGGASKGWSLLLPPRSAILPMK